MATALSATLVGVYALQWAFGATDGLGLVHMGATSPVFWERLHVWTVFSSTLLHIGVLHLLANTYFTYVVGGLLERVIGPWRMLLVFFAGGTVGSLLSVVLLSDTVSAGASGGAWGLMIAMLLLLLSPWLRVGTRLRAGPVGPLLRLIGLNAVLSFLPGINGLAHLGGGLGGAMAVVITARGGRIWAVPAGLAYLVHLGALAVAVFVGRPWALGDVGPVERRTVLDGYVSLELPIAMETADTPEGLATLGGSVDWDPLTVSIELARFDEPPWAGIASQAVPCPGNCQARRAQNASGGEALWGFRPYGPYALVTVFAMPAGIDDPDWALQAVQGATLTEAGVGLLVSLAVTARSDGDPATHRDVLEALLIDHPDSSRALNQLAWQLATDPDPAWRDGARAVELAKRAVELEPLPSYQDTLAAARAETGDFAEAVRIQRQVVEADPDPGFGAHLAVLERGEPVREDPMAARTVPAQGPE